MSHVTIGKSDINFSPYPHRNPVTPLVQMAQPAPLSRRCAPMWHLTESFGEYLFLFSSAILSSFFSPSLFIHLAEYTYSEAELYKRSI